MRLISVWYQDFYPFDLLFPNHTKLLCHEVDHQTLTRDDVVILWGGIDVDPDTYGHNNVASDNGGTYRDQYELNWIEAAKEAGAICIGVCRGLQILAVANGGWLVQHINGHAIGDHGHRVTSIAQPQISFMVNSYHHQTVVLEDCVNEYTVLAVAELLNKEYDYDIVNTGRISLNNVIEAVSWPGNRQIGVQWHPEWMNSHSEATEWLFKEIKKL